MNMYVLISGRRSRAEVFLMSQTVRNTAVKLAVGYQKLSPASIMAQRTWGSDCDRLAIVKYFRQCQRKDYSRVDHISL